MALFVYRFRLKVPINLSQLEAEVGVPVSLDDYSGGLVLDIECDDSRAEDLKASLDEQGYEFVGGSPSSSAEQQFKNDNNLSGFSPSANQIGEILISEDGSDFVVGLPITEYEGGWLINDYGEHIING